MSRVRSWIPLLGILLLLPTLASAQGTAITGTVTDATGAVLPGVTVVAASDALIEKQRTAVTNEVGRYQILSLVPGTYTVTFTLDNFVPVKREGIILRSDFTAPVSVQMKPGGGAEVLTIQATAPLVDVTNVTKPQAMTAEMLDTLPLGSRTIQDIASTVPSVGFGAFGNITFRGNADTLTTIDGNRTVWLNGPSTGSSTQALSAAAYEEYSFTQAIDNVESATGGMRINVVPKDGGNRFSGSNFLIYTREGWASDNRGKYAGAPYNFTQPAATKLLLDINPTVGGPIIKDKLWYQNTAHIKLEEPILPGIFPDTNPDPWIFTGDQSKVMVNKERFYGGGTRITWQASPKDKIAGSYDDQWYHWPTFFVATGANPLSAFNNVVPHQLNTSVKWTRTQTSRLLLEGGGSVFILQLANDVRAGGEGWSAWKDRSALKASGLPIASVDNMAVVNTSLGFGGLAVGNQTQTNSWSPSNSYTGNFSGTYIRGAHTIKAGMSVLIGDTVSDNRQVGDAVLQIQNVGGATIATGITASIPTSNKNKINGDWGFYAQDQWVHKRLTVKGSLRYDNLRTSFPDQVQVANVWLAEQNCSTNPAFCGKSILNWKDISPRASAAYDVFGNGKTAIKFGWARYVAGETTGLTSALNPVGAISRTSTASWTDLDGNKGIYDAAGNVQRNELGVFGNQNFGTAIIATQYDPDILRGWGKRGYTYETNLGIDHQLLPRLSTSVTYYHRTQGNQTTTDNLSTVGEPGVDYTGPYCLRAPTDPLIPGGGGFDVCGLYNITAEGQRKSFLPASNLVTFFDKLGGKKGRQDVRDGFDIALRSNLPGGAFITGGFDIASTLTDTCDFSESPERRFCHNRQAFNVLPRISGSYTVPEFAFLGAAKKIVQGIQISGNYAMTRGPNLTASWTANNCNPGNAATFGCNPRFDDYAFAASLGLTPLGRDLTQVGRSGAISRSATGQSRTVALFASGQDYLPYIHNFDLRFAKVISVNRFRVTAGVDLYNAFNINSITSVQTGYGYTELLAGETRTYAQINNNGIPDPRQLQVNLTVAF